MNAAFGWLTQSNGDIQCTYGQIPLHAIANGPANHTPRIQIKNDSKVKPPFVRLNIGYIARPFLVWPISRKVLIKQIGCDVECVITVSCYLVFLGADDLDAVIAHQTTYAPVPNVHSQFLQLFSHAWPPIAF